MWRTESVNGVQAMCFPENKQVFAANQSYKGNDVMLAGV